VTVIVDVTVIVIGRPDRGRARDRERHRGGDRHRQTMTSIATIRLSNSPRTEYSVEQLTLGS